jgi:hypothetical protein
MRANELCFFGSIMNNQNLYMARLPFRHVLPHFQGSQRAILGEMLYDRCGDLGSGVYMMPCTMSKHPIFFFF